MDISDPTKYSEMLGVSFGVQAGVLALNILLDNLPPEARKEISGNMLREWKKTWKSSFQEEVGHYSKEIGKFVDSEDLLQPEELQMLFNRALADVENSVKIAMRMDKKSMKEDEESGE